MTFKPRFKVAYVPWWRPLRLAKKNEQGGFDFVGWVWRQKAYIVNNLNHGWIAFVEDQTETKLKTCPSCGHPSGSHGYEDQTNLNTLPVGGYQPIGTTGPISAPPKAP